MRPIDADALINKLPKEYLNSIVHAMINEAPTIEPKAKVIAQVTFDEEKMREIVKEAVERFKEEYEIEPKRGEWIETSDGTMCGNCHKFPYDDGEYHIANWYSNFCPVCGADMRKREGE